MNDLLFECIDCHEIWESCELDFDTNRCIDCGGECLELPTEPDIA